MAFNSYYGIILLIGQSHWPKQIFFKFYIQSYCIRSHKCDTCNYISPVIFSLQTKRYLQQEKRFKCAHYLRQIILIFTTTKLPYIHSQDVQNSPLCAFTFLCSTLWSSETTFASKKKTIFDQFSLLMVYSAYKGSL